MVNIYSYNVNGIRAAVNKGFLDFVQKANPDIICLQELKALREQIPLIDIKTLGYNCYSLSAKKKGYSGVAILTKKEPKNIVYGMGIDRYDDEGRMIRVDFDNLSVASIYHPSGTSGDIRQEFKMQWLKDFQAYVCELRKDIPNLVLCGDYNICHQDIDIHDPKGNKNHSGFLPEERQWVTDFLNEGFIDSFRYLHPDKIAYSWWSYFFSSRAKNKGWRIDYCMVNNVLKDKIVSADICPEFLQSDHCPVCVGIDTDI